MKLFFISILTIRTLYLFSQPDFRDSIDVLNYSIHLDLSETETNQLSGRTDLKILSLYPAKTISLDFEGLYTDSVFIDHKKADFLHRGPTISLFPEQITSLKDTLVVTVYYHGSPLKDKEWGGFFIDRDYAFNYGVGMYSNPPNYGRCWFPCIDNFKDRAFYEYFIRTKKNHFAACPGLLKSITEESDHTKIFHWKLNQSIPTYLSSVAVADYSVVKDSVQGIERTIPVELYIFRGMENTTLKTFSNVKNFLHAFEERFGPYRWDKIGYVSTKFDGGAMEHATNIAYSSNCDYSNECEETLAHELSHHWFGNLVTCSSEKDMWLNEGWARYCEAVYYEYSGGESAYKKKIRENHFQVLSEAVNNPSEYGLIYDMPHKYTYGSIVYNKGGDVAHSLRGQLGDSLFFNTLRSYFSTFAFSNVSVKQFQEFLSRFSKTNLTDFFNFWVYSSGFPNFSISNYKIIELKNKYELNFTVSQYLLNTNQILKSTWIEIGVLDSNLNLKKFRLKQTGKTERHKINTDFKPKLILIDPDEKIGDATTDEYMTITRPGEYQFIPEYFILNLVQQKQPIFFQIVYNWIAPPNSVVKNYTLYNKYWEIKYYSPDKTVQNGRFFVPTNTGIKNFIESSNIKNIYFLYRETNESEWQSIESEIGEEGNFLVADIKNLKNGQYTFGLKE